MAAAGRVADATDGVAIFKHAFVPARALCEQALKTQHQYFCGEEFFCTSDGRETAAGVATRAAAMKPVSPEQPARRRSRR
jgi:hypothetical protein